MSVDNGNGTQPVEKDSFLIRIPRDQKRAFEDMYPWHGSLSQFLLQCITEFLEVSKEQKTPAQLTREAVTNVARTNY